MRYYLLLNISCLILIYLNFSHSNNESQFIFGFTKRIEDDETDATSSGNRILREPRNRSVPRDELEDVVVEKNIHPLTRQIFPNYFLEICVLNCASQSLHFSLFSVIDVKMMPTQRIHFRVYFFNCPVNKCHNSINSNCGNCEMHAISLMVCIRRLSCNSFCFYGPLSNNVVFTFHVDHRLPCSVARLRSFLTSLSLKK